MSTVPPDEAALETEDARAEDARAAGDPVLAAERDRLARTLRDTRLQLAMTQARLSALEDSATLTLGRMLVLGVPIGLQYTLEWGVFGTVLLLMGRLGTVPVAAHQIAINVASLTFMVPLGVSAAATVLVGHAVGRADPTGVRRSAGAALATGIAFMSLKDANIKEYEIGLDPVYVEPNNPANDRPHFLYVPPTDHIAKIEKEDVERIDSFGPWHSAYFASYFTITGLHGAHVLAGVLVFIYMWLPVSKKLYQRNPEHLANRVEVSGLFWHFVDLVWIFVFPLFYLL